MEVRIVGTAEEIAEAYHRINSGAPAAQFGVPRRSNPKVITCIPKSLPRHKWIDAARTAIGINPVNGPALSRLSSLAMPGFMPTPDFLAVVTQKYWRSGLVKLTVGFLDNPPAELQTKILQHMNAWARTANVEFVESGTDSQVRIAREPGSGYWSYVGTDILQIEAGQPTMNLDSFSVETPDSEFYRVVRHETGHTIGCPHEHMRAELVALIDPQKAIDYFRRTQGWSEQETRAQVLTPIEERSLIGTAHPDPNSIMCYQIPGEITINGNPIPGGLDISDLDYQFIATIYPRPNTPTSTTIIAAKPSRTPVLGDTAATLANCNISFHTNNEDKDSDTHVTVTVRDQNNVVCALVSNDFGHFDDNSDSGPFALSVQNPSTKGSIQRGSVTVRIDPNGHDTWRFNFFLNLQFSDGNRLSGGASGLELSQDRREQTFGVDGILQG